MERQVEVQVTVPRDYGSMGKLITLPVEKLVELRDLLAETVGMYELYSELLTLFPGDKYPKKQQYCVKLTRCREEK